MPQVSESRESFEGYLFHELLPASLRAVADTKLKNKVTRGGYDHDSTTSATKRHIGVYLL